MPCAAWKAARPDAAAIARRAARAALRGAGRRPGRAGLEVSLVLTNDRTIKALNARWRRRDEPTNVLSFPAEDRVHLGDVVLAFETVRREAKAQGKTLGDHLAHLVVHGVLHLVGYNHMTRREAAAMEALERCILAGLGIADPYVLG
jgi:probable rRNA maturation factor